MREEVLYEIFLNLHTAYDTLYRDRCLDILTAPPTVVLGPPRHGDQGRGILCQSIQRVPGGHTGGPLYPMIFNIAVDAVCHAALDNGCGGRRGGARRLWEGGAEDGDVFLSLKRPPRLYAATVAAEGILRPDGALRPGCSA